MILIAAKSNFTVQAQCLRQSRESPEARRDNAKKPQISDDMIRKLYDTYVVARQRTGESISGLTYESLASRLRTQVPELMARHKARNIEFKVVIKGGKAVLKAIPHT